MYSSALNGRLFQLSSSAAAGSRSERLTAPNDLWEMDGTKGDVLLADGRRWAITAVVDVFTRRAMLRLSPSARAADTTDRT